MAGTASAHAIWLERDNAGPVRIYLDEIAPKEKEEDQTHRLKTSVVFTADPARPAALIRKEQDRHFVASVADKGDVRLRNDQVFAPWTDGGVRHGNIFYARAGRNDTAPKLDFELVPVESGGRQFTLLLRGKPVANAAVSVFSPQRVETKLTTDAAGRVTVPATEKGRYIIEASANEERAAKSFGEDVARLVHVTTLSYVES
ncbi:hypothetical protein ASE00_05425 [Sphingomonas sp. Root710]|nr:hypothetical protein ASE00_05425 [Sphingomonas sp. Root710]